MADTPTPIGYWHPERGTFTFNPKASANTQWVPLHKNQDLADEYARGYQQALNDCINNGIDWARGQLA